MGCPRLTYQLKTVYRTGVAGVTREERVSRKNLKTTVDKGLYYYGARYYEPKSSIWMGVDAMATSYPGINPYNFVTGNPIMAIDPDGDTTFVQEISNNIYQVDYVETRSGDKSVFAVSYDENGNRVLGARIGKTLSTHSFVAPGGRSMRGAIIDLNSREGEEWLKSIYNQRIDPFKYFQNAGYFQKYDYKTKGMDPEYYQKVEDKEGKISINFKPEYAYAANSYVYRGSMLGNSIVSARDIGNIGAGIQASRGGLPKSMMRLGFDAYEAMNTGGIFSGGTVEPFGSAYPQNRGSDIHFFMSSLNGDWDRVLRILNI
jgi:RHS repeat-associated protein